MPTADATLLPPPYHGDGLDRLAEDPGSVRRLDEVGVETVLEAMIEQKRRASQPSFPGIELPHEHEHEHEREHDEESRRATSSDVFLKAR